MVKSYTFNEKNNFSKKGVEIASKYLKSLSKTIEVINVEGDPNFQTKDIDLFWIYKKGDENIKISIEVKTDNYTTGNFFLETISNKVLNTIGCFLKTEAKYIFYYFTKWDSLYVIPMKKAKQWFIDNLHRFKEMETSTKDENGNYVHTTVGRLVKIRIIMEEVKGIKLIKNVSKKINNS